MDSCSGSSFLARAGWMCLGCAMAGLLFIAPARATSDAARFFRAGRDAYHQAHYAKAADAFRRAYEIEPRPFLLFNIALCHEKMGDFQTALQYYERYLRAVPGERGTLESHLRELRSRVPATLILHGGIVGSEVWLDGVRAGNLPVEKLELPAGRPVELRVVHAGYQPFVTVLRAETADAGMEVTIIQVPDEPASDVSAHAPPQVRPWAGDLPAAAHVPRRDAGLSSPALIERFDAPRKLTFPVWTGVAGITFLAVSGVLGYWALQTARDAQDIPSWENARQNELSRKARRLALGADALLGTGLACLGISFYFSF